MEIVKDYGNCNRILGSEPTLVKSNISFKGENNIWSETNGQQIDVKYWTHKNLTPIPLTDYLENQTWSSMLAI